MKRENDEITDLFRSRLDHVGMPVRDGFWEELNQGMETCHHRRLILFRLTAAASVLLVLAASSTAFWYFSPKEEIENSFTQIAVANGGTLDGDGVKQIDQPTSAEPALLKPAGNKRTQLIPCSGKQDDSASIMVSMSFSFSMNSTVMRRENRRTNGHDLGLWRTARVMEQKAVATEQEPVATVLTKAEKKNRWSLKAAAGLSLPTGEDQCKMPVTAALTVEKPLNKYLALEAGLLYSNLRSEARQLHYLGIPLKMNIALAETKNFDLYATVGGIADKCIAGAPNNNFGSEPIQLALTAGLGMRYKISDRIALFAEPGVTHHFDTDSELRTVRTERPTNFNLICGLRMTY